MIAAKVEGKEAREQPARLAPASGDRRRHQSDPYRHLLNALEHQQETTSHRHRLPDR